jgi:uncharacterized protein
MGGAACADRFWMGRGNSRRSQAARSLHWLSRVWAVLAPLLLAHGTALAAGLEFPPMTGLVVDEAHVLSAQTAASLNGKLKALEAKSSDQLVVFIAKSLQGHSIEDYGYQLGRAWGVGRKGLDNGVLLIAVPSERQVRIEVGRKLEPMLTDAFSTLIIEGSILPAFRNGDLEGGILKGVANIESVLLGDAEAVKQRAEAFASRRGPLTFSEIVALIVGAAMISFVLYRIYANWRRLSAARLGHGKGSSRKGLYEWMWSSTPGQIAGAFLLTLADIFGGGGGGSSGGSSNSSSSSSSGGGGDFGGGGASGRW